MQSTYKATNLFVAFFLSLTFLALTSLSRLALAAEETDSSPKDAPVREKQSLVYYTLANEFNAPLTEPMESFDCTDKIFTVVELRDYPEGKHQLSVRWFDPTDGQREHTKYDFNISKTDIRLWAWLSLSRAQGAGMLTWINPAAGLEDFIGPWTVEVRIDDKKISDSSFEVSC